MLLWKKKIIKVIGTPERDKVGDLLLLYLISVNTDDHEEIPESEIKPDLRFINNLSKSSDCPIQRGITSYG